MPIDTITLALKGKIPLKEFSDAVKHFSELIKNLSGEIGGETNIDWDIVRLEAGSAITAVRGISAQAGVVERVVQAYEIIGQSLEKGLPIPYSEEVIKEARAITNVLDGNITSVVFQTDQVESHINHPIENKEEWEMRYSLGSVSGIVDTLSRRRGLKFYLYDSLFDRGVICVLEESQQEVMREAWGKSVTVTGRIFRDPETGRPVAVRNISKVDIHTESQRGIYKNIRGVFSWKEGDEYPEQNIRRMRDAE